MTLQELLNKCGVARQEINCGEINIAEESYGAKVKEVRPGLYEADDGNDDWYLSVEGDSQRGYAVTVCPIKWDGAPLELSEAQVKKIWNDPGAREYLRLLMKQGGQEH